MKPPMPWTILQVVHREVVDWLCIETNKIFPHRNGGEGFEPTVYMQERLYDVPRSSIRSINIHDHWLADARLYGLICFFFLRQMKSSTKQQNKTSYIATTRVLPSTLSSPGSLCKLFLNVMAFKEKLYIC